METKTVQERVIEVLTKTTKSEAGDITPETELAGQVLGEDWDNLIGRAVLLVDLEDEFDYEIDGDTAGRWRTVADIIAYIESIPQS